MSLAHATSNYKEGTLMSVDISRAGGRDRSRINVNEDYELRDWSEVFGVTPEQLKQAVEAVGDRIERVRAYLQSLRQPRAALRN